MRSRLARLWNALCANRPLAFTVGGVTFVSLRGFSASGYQRSNQPGFCWSCHEMRYHYNSWRASSHKGVNCEECHAIPGVWGMMRTKFGGLKQVAVHLKEGQRTYGSLVVQAHVPDENCLQCHAEVLEVITYHSLTITHRKHWDRGVHCTTCHAKVVHGDRPEVKNTPKMTVCYRCHDGNCDNCHRTARTTRSGSARTGSGRGTANSVRPVIRLLRRRQFVVSHAA